MKYALLFAALIACGAVDAQTYVGGSVGRGKNTAPSDNHPPAHFFATYNQESLNVSAFTGYRDGWWGVEAGVFSLPRFKGEGYTPDYTAYRGYADPTHPQTAQITGLVRGTALYARGQVYGPEIGKFTPYAFAGVAMSFNKLYQFGYYNHTEFVENKVKFRTVAEIAGVGVQYQMCDRWTARLEYTNAPGIFDNPHTGRRSVAFWSLGLARAFQ